MLNAGRGNETLDLTLLRDISADRDRFSASGDDFRRNFLSFGDVVAGINDHFGSGRAEAFRNSRAEALAASGDEGDVAIQAHVVARLSDLKSGRGW